MLEIYISVGHVCNRPCHLGFRYSTVFMYSTKFPVKPCKPAERPPLKSVRLLDQVRERIHYKHYSVRTEEAYVYWVRWFIRFHQLKHPKDMGSVEVTAFLSWLAAERGVFVG